MNASTETISWGAGMSGLTYSEIFALNASTVHELKVATDEAALHLRGEEVHMLHEAGLHTLHPEARNEAILFLSTAPMPVMEIGETHTTRFVDVVHGPLQIQIAGAARLHIGDPTGFYNAFLRHTASLAPDQFETILSALVHSSLGHVLQESYDSVDDIERDLGRLAAYAQRRLETLLSPVGVAVDRLELTRLETPTPGGSLVENGTPSLVTS